MSYDIYGNKLRSGYCEVHPDIPGQFPCGECERERQYYEQQSRQGAEYDEYQRGRDDERKAIVAWLRANSGEWFSNITDNGQCEHGSWSWDGCETCGVSGITKAIQSGAHNE